MNTYTLIYIFPCGAEWHQIMLSMSTRNFHQASSWSREESTPCMTDGWACFSHKQSPGWSSRAKFLEVLSNHNSHWAAIQHSSASGTLKFAWIRISEFNLMSCIKVAGIQHLSAFASLSRALLTSVHSSYKGVEGGKEWVGWLCHNVFIYWGLAVIPFMLGKKRQSKPSRDLKQNEIYTLFSALLPLTSIAFRYKDWHPYYQTWVIQKWDIHSSKLYSCPIMGVMRGRHNRRVICPVLRSVYRVGCPLEVPFSFCWL